MMKSAYGLIAILFLSLYSLLVQAQPLPPGESKPYKIVTSGKQITIKSNKAIKQVMVWTAGGNRVVEQKGINATSYILTIPVNQSNFFMMIGLNDGRIYTEKIGLRY